jgi:hypothetical protein
VAQARCRLHPLPWNAFASQANVVWCLRRLRCRLLTRSASA